MKRVLFLCHVDKRWIKQRPHFVAEALAPLSEEFCFAYARAYGRSGLMGGRLQCPTLPLFLVPQRMRDTLPMLDWVLQICAGLALGVRFRPTVVWVTSARMVTIGRVAARVARGRLVMDVMDRTVEFENSTSRDSELEEKAIRDAAVVVCSSQALVDDVEKMGTDARVHLMRNALAEPARWRSDIEASAVDPGAVSLGYAGSIASWFDWDLVSQALERNPGWELHLWGPVDSSIPSSDQVFSHGTVEHGRLPGLLTSCDVLVMPFQVTPLIEAVDPVKAYEYVATGLPVVLVEYRETSHFESVATFYEAGSVKSFEEAIGRSLQDVRYGQFTFAEQNTWAERIRVLMREHGDLLC